MIAVYAPTDTHEVWEPRPERLPHRPTRRTDGAALTPLPPAEHSDPTDAYLQQAAQTCDVRDVTTCYLALGARTVPRGRVTAPAKELATHLRIAEWEVTWGVDGPCEWVSRTVRTTLTVRLVNRTTCAVILTPATVKNTSRTTYVGRVWEATVPSGRRFTRDSYDYRSGEYVLPARVAVTAVIAAL